MDAVVLEFARQTAIGLPCLYSTDCASWSNARPWGKRSKTGRVPARLPPRIGACKSINGAPLPIFVIAFLQNYNCNGMRPAVTCKL
jgi:hypothetical protein